MDLQENMAKYIRSVMERENKSYSELAEELGISRNSLYSYGTGTGNPTLSTVGQLSEKMEVNPAILLGLPNLDREEALRRIMEIIQDVKELTEEGRRRFAELFLEMVGLWDEE